TLLRRSLLCRTLLRRSLLSCSLLSRTLLSCSLLCRTLLSCTLLCLVTASIVDSRIVALNSRSRIPCGFFACCGVVAAFAVGIALALRGRLSGRRYHQQTGKNRRGSDLFQIL